MGLFDKKPSKKDDFDSPVEEVNLSKAAKPALPGMPPAPRLDAARPPGAAGSTQPPQQAKPAAPAPAPQAAAKPAPAPQPAPEPEPDFDINFGINKAIELWRKLPKDNVELVVTVIKTTLESLHIKVPSIVNDASRKQSEIEKRIEFLKKEIADLDSEINLRRKEIGGLEADHAETTEVKDRLQLAEKLASEKKVVAK